MRKLAFATISFATLCEASTAWSGAVVASDRPRIDTETAFIHWDAESRVENLCIAARFSNIKGPFAWWLPVPGEPVVHTNAGQDMRASFAKLIASYRARTKGWELPALGSGNPREDLVFGGHGQVDVAIQDVSSEERARRWLSDEGLHRNPALTDYLTRYANQSHRLVVVRADPRQQVWVSPFACMRFETPRPWYPYREPAYASDPGADDQSTRLLRIYVLSTERVAMQLGVSRPTMAYAWLSFETTREEVGSALPSPWARDLGLRSGQRLWLTSFEDRNVVRPGDDDLMFATAGAIPKDGAPGTLNDKTGAGIELHPIDRSTARAPVEPTKEIARPNEKGRREMRKRKGPGALVVFGWMAAMSLVIAGWLGWRTMK